MTLTRLIEISHIPLLSYVPTNLNYVYFKLNFCTENWQRTISFSKLESNLMINAVSVKKVRKLFCTSFGNSLSLNPFGMKLVTGSKKGSCFLNEEFSFLSCIGLVNDTTNLLFHHALLIVRYHIYFSKQKGLNPSWELFFQTILNCLDYERRYAIKTGILRKFNAKWGAFIRDNDL